MVFGMCFFILMVVSSLFEKAKVQQKNVISHFFCQKNAKKILQCQKMFVPLHPKSSRSRAVVARRAHNPEVVGSSPASATNWKPAV